MKSKGGIIAIISLLLAICVCLIGIMVMFMVKGDSFNTFNKIKVEKGGSYPLVLEETVDKIPDVINLESDIASINIKNSTDGKIHISVWANKDLLQYNTTDSLISVIEKEDKNFKTGIPKKSKIEIFVPSDYSGLFDIESDCGNIHVEAFASALIKVETDSGNINIDEIKDLKAECDTGNLTVSKLNNSIDANVDCGNVTINEATINLNSRIITDTGNITINNINDIRVDAHSDTGKIRISTNNESSTVFIKVDADCGNITVG